MIFNFNWNFVMTISTTPWKLLSAAQLRQSANRLFIAIDIIEKTVNCQWSALQILHQLCADVYEIIYRQIHVFAIFFVIEIRTIKTVWTDQIHQKITQVIHPCNATFAVYWRTDWWDTSWFARRGAKRHPLKSLLPPSCFRRLSQTSRRSPHLIIKDESNSKKLYFTPSTVK